MSAKRGVILFAGICTAMGLTLSVLVVKAIRFAARRINTATLEVRRLESHYRDSLQQKATYLVKRYDYAELLLNRRDREIDSLINEDGVVDEIGEELLQERSAILLDKVKALFKRLVAGADCDRCTKEILHLLSVGEDYEISVSGRKVAIGWYCQRLSVMRDAVVVVRVQGEFDMSGKLLGMVVEEGHIDRKDN